MIHMANKIQTGQKEKTAPEAENRKQLEEYYMALRMIDQQMKQAQKQMAMIEQQATDLEGTKEALEDLSKVEPGTEILVPVASGVFAKATLADASKLIVNIGANTSVTKGLEDVKKIIEQQAEEIRKIESEIGSQIQSMASQAQMIEQEMNRLT